MELLLWVAILLISIAALIKASDTFSDSAEKIGLKLKIPYFIIGATIVSFGTSLPELVSSVYAVTHQAPEIVFAGVAGSNIANILFILGVSAVIGGGLSLTYDLLHVDLPIFIGATFLAVLTALDGSVSVSDGVILFLGLLIYLSYVSSVRRKEGKEIFHEAVASEHGRDYKVTPKTYLLMLLSVVVLAIAAKYAVDSIVEISSMVGISRGIVGLTVFSFGTSLPELFVCIHASRKGLTEVVTGSILGSSIFNIFAVLGIPAMFGALPITETMIGMSLPMLLSSGLLYFFITQEKQISKWEGMLLILFYIFFIVTLVERVGVQLG